MNIKKLTLENYDQLVNEAARLIARNKVVILPFDTVYGVACSASNNEALKKIFKLKNRPLDQTIGIAVHDFEYLKKFSQDLSKEKTDLIKNKVPGKFTFIIKENPKVNISPYCVKNGTVAIRIPESHLILNIINRSGKIIAQTSANKTGKENCSSVEEILEQYRQEELEEVTLIIDNSRTPSHKASKIFDLTTDKIIQIR